MTVRRTSSLWPASFHRLGAPEDGHAVVVGVGMLLQPEFVAVAEGLGSGPRWQSCALSCRSRGTGADSSAHRWPGAPGRRLHCARDRRGTGGQRDAGTRRRRRLARTQSMGRGQRSAPVGRAHDTVDGKRSLSPACSYSACRSLLVPVLMVPPPLSPVLFFSRTLTHDGARAGSGMLAPGAGGAWLAPERERVCATFSLSLPPCINPPPPSSHTNLFSLRHSLPLIPPFSLSPTLSPPSFPLSLLPLVCLSREGAHACSHTRPLRECARCGFVQVCARKQTIRE